MEKVRQWYLSLRHAFPGFFGPRVSALCINVQFRFNDMFHAIPAAGNLRTGLSETLWATGNGHRWFFCPSCRIRVGELSEPFGTVARNVDGVGIIGP
jgi:hypothetical protein